jgi:hypothetical protein
MDDAEDEKGTKRRRLAIRQNEGDILYGDVANKVLVLFQQLHQFASSREPAHDSSFFFADFLSDPVVGDHVSIAVGSVEIMWDGKLNRVFFPIEKMCQRMDIEDQKKISEGVNRVDGQETKVRDFIEMHLHALHNQLHYQRSLKQACNSRRPEWLFGLLPMVFSRSTLFFTTNFSFLVVCLINLLNVLCIRRVYEHIDVNPDGSSTTLLLPWSPDINETDASIGRNRLSSLYADQYPQEGDLSTEMYWYGNAAACPVHYANVVEGLGVVQALFAFLSLTVYMIVVGPITFLNACDETERLCEEIKLTAKASRLTDIRVAFLKNLYPCIKMFLLEFHIAYYIIYAVISVMAIAGSSFLYAMLLFDVLMKNETAHNVLKSVTMRKGQLCVTAFISVLVIYVFSLFGWLFLPDDYSAETCDTLWRCMYKSMNAGLLYGELPNFGSASKYSYRGFFDMTFFIVVLTVLLNIVFGIIIDTFTELREMKEAKEADKKSVCFVCGLDQKAFDDYRSHTGIDHNMWHLAFLVIRIWEKSADDDNGYESYIRQKLKSRDVSWVPIGRALELELQELADAKAMTKASTSMLTQELQWLDTGPAANGVGGANSGDGGDGGGGGDGSWASQSPARRLTPSKSVAAAAAAAAAAATAAVEEAHQPSREGESVQTANADANTLELQKMVVELQKAMEKSNETVLREIKRINARLDQANAITPTRTRT